MITIKDNKGYLSKDTVFEYIDEMAIIERKNDEIYCVYKCIMKSPTNKGYIIVYSDGSIGYETLGKGTTIGQVVTDDEFYVCHCRHIDINVDALVTY